MIVSMIVMCWLWLQRILYGEKIKWKSRRDIDSIISLSIHMILLYNIILVLIGKKNHLSHSSRHILSSIS